MKMKTKQEIKAEIKLLYMELNHITENIPAGNCHYRICKSKIETLQWVIGET